MQLPQYLLELSSMSEAGQRKLLIWLSVLMAVVIVGGFGLMWLRRKIHQLHDSGASSESDAGFSLSSLRDMRDRGEITPEEYEVTRARVIARVKAAADKPTAPRKDPRQTFGGN